MAAATESMTTGTKTGNLGEVQGTYGSETSPLDEIGYLRIMASDPELSLDTEDIPNIEKRKREINVEDMNSITGYGLDLKQKMAGLSQMMMENFNDSDEEEVDDALNQMVAYLGSVDFNEEPKNKRILFWRKKAEGLTVREKYDSVSKNVDRVGHILEEHQVRLLKDCALLDRVFGMNKEFYHQLNILIIAVKKKIEEIQTQSFSYDSDMSSVQTEIAWENSVIERLERKVTELELSRSIALQQASQIRMLQTNSAIMADKLQSTLYNTIPLWKNQIVLALGAEHAREAVRTNQQITYMTNELLVKNAQKLKMVTIETANAADTNFVDVKAIEASNKALAESLDEIARIRSEKRTERIAAEQELSRIDSELKGGI